MPVKLKGSADPQEESPSIWQGTADERLKMAKDRGRLTRFELYKAPFKRNMIDGVRKYSLKATPLVDKRISNVMIPLVRMIADSCITSMSAGNPSFNIKPRALADYPKVDILKPAIDQVLEETNFPEQQNTFLTDGTVMGTSALEVFTQVPQRKDENGKPVRDFSRPRIGIRARSGLEISFDPTLRNHSQKGAVHWQDRMSDDLFDEEYRIVRLSDGTHKFKNTEAVKSGIRMSINPQGMVLQRQAGMYDFKGIIVDHIQDPLQNFYRTYANNVLIYDKPLYMRRRKDGTHTDGDNALGDTRLCVWTNNDQYDDNDSTHSLYGAGEPWLLWGLDRMYNDFGNMLIDNYALANTFGLSYKPEGLHAGGLDLDSTDFYSGMFIQGEIVVTPFGEVRLQDFQNIKEIIDEWCVFVTGVNFKNLIGEQGSTAFEVATKIRASNRRYEYKLKKIEDTVYKKLGKHILAAIFTTYTVDDFELITGESRDEIANAFAEGKIPEEDLIFTDVKGQKMITGVKHKTMIHIPGKVFKEKLGADKRRKSYGQTGSTLSEDISKRGQADSFVPAAEEYIHTMEYLERGQLPNIVVDTGTMISGKEQVELSDLQQMWAYEQQRIQMSAPGPNGQPNPELATNFDPKKMDERMTELLGFTPESLMKDGTQFEKDKQKIQQMDDNLEQMHQIMKQPSLPSPMSNAPPGLPQATPEGAAQIAGAGVASPVNPGAATLQKAAPLGAAA